MSAPTVLTEDETFLIILKPAGMSVHATNPGQDQGTLVEWLATRDPQLEMRFPKPADDIWRPGIVHRLDQDTSGVMVVAKTAKALQKLQDQFRGRTTQKIYRALVAGITDKAGEFSGAIARSDADPTHQEIRRLSFSWSKGKAREAETTYRRLAETKIQPQGLGAQETPGVGFRGISLVELTPKTGRMHQLRVQLAEAGWPILGDEKYGSKISQQISTDLEIHRQLLHAWRLSFDHPETNERLTFHAPYPADFLAALKALDLPFDA